MQPVGSLAEAWDLVRRDLATHTSGEAVYLRSGLSEAGPLDSVGLTAAESAQIERVTVGVRGGLEVGGGVPRAETPDALASALAGIADLVQDVVEESFYEAWPQCPCHARSATVEVQHGVVLWRCRSGDWSVRVGELSDDGGAPSA
jgi:hypothetical protein